MNFWHGGKLVADYLNYLFKKIILLDHNFKRFVTWIFIFLKLFIEK